MSEASPLGTWPGRTKAGEPMAIGRRDKAKHSQSNKGNVESRSLEVRGADSKKWTLGNGFPNTVRLPAIIVLSYAIPVVQGVV